MAEFLRTFTSGRMNKDLDERLLPNGEYRDALNLDLSSSEGSDIGSLQLLKGNLELKNSSYNTSTQSLIEWNASTYISEYTNAFCVGSIADDTNDKIYWIVGSDDYNCIAEYDLKTKVTVPVLVEDKSISNFLNFSESYLVTGINLLQGYLIWTDNQTEPKQISIEKFKAGTSDFVTQTAFSDGVLSFVMAEKDTTVASIGPLYAPELGLYNTLRSRPVDSSFSYNLAGIPGTPPTGDNVLSIAPDTIITVSLDSPAEYQAGDRVLAYATIPNSGGGNLVVYANFIVTTEYEDSSGGYNYDFQFKSIGSGGEQQSNFVLDLLQLWEVELVGEKTLFEKKFVTYAYRYVYDNNQISPFSPFSKVAFLPQRYDFESYTGYNKGMLNDLKKVDVFFGKDLPLNASKVEVLFKETHNTTVYTVKSINRSDLGDTNQKTTITVSPDEPNYLSVSYVTIAGNNIVTSLAPGATGVFYHTQNSLITSVPTFPLTTTIENTGYGLEITSEIVRGAVETNQLLRPWDNVPKKALAQEVIGNRIVYGNYTQNYTVDDTFTFDTTRTILNEEPFSSSYQAEEPYPTIKSLRTYQFGIVFKDKYGRETPVFSNEKAVVGSTIENSDGKFFLTAGMNGISPRNADGSEMFEYFKFFIKDPTLPYYNAVADQMYLSPDGYSAWVSFPSSEVNKFEVGDHIILKKTHGESSAVQTSDNRYKVLAIETEPPADISFRYDILHADDHGFSAAFPYTGTATELVYGNTPVEGSNVFSIAGGSSSPFTNDNGTQRGNYVRFIKDGVFSQYYRIDELEQVSGSWLLTVFPKFGSDVNFLYATPGDEQSLLNLPITTEISERAKIETYEEFKGRFFARLESNSTLTSSFLGTSSFTEGAAATFNNQPANWYNGRLDTAGRIQGAIGAGLPTSDTILGNVNTNNQSYNDGWYFTGGGMGPSAGFVDDEGYSNINAPWTFGGLSDRSDNFGIGPVQDLAIWGDGGPSSRFSDITGNKSFKGIGSTNGYYRGRPTDEQGGDGDEVKTGLNMRAPSSGKPWDVHIGRRIDGQFTGTGGFKGIAKNLVAGTKIRFSNHDTEYTIVESGYQTGWETQFWGLLFDKRLQHPVNAYAMYNIINYNNRPAGTYDPLPYTQTLFEVQGQQYLPIDRTDPENPTGRIDIEMIVLVQATGDRRVDENPAIFETEPDESLDLNLYYEASDAIPISQYSETHRLPWFNSFGFANGVESNRIRDDFNAFEIGKGAKVSTVLDEPYEEEIRSNGFIFSQIFNSTAGINRLNQFIQALPITKELNPIYGSIQKLYSRDTDLITLCEDKCFRVLANKDALYNADGNTNITGNTNVLGQAVPYVGEFGISTNPESFAFFGFRAYFADKSRGSVMRLSRDGLTEISNVGLADFFADNLKLNKRIIGTYDEDSQLYNLSLNTLSAEWQEKLAEGTVDRADCDDDIDIGDPKVTETTVSFAEGTKGWESRKSFIPEAGVSINNNYYTFKNGLLWIHAENETYNNFYGVQYFSTMTTIFNDGPTVVKGFKALDYVGSRPRNYVYSTGDGVNYSIAQVVAGNLTPTGQSVPANKEGWYAQAIVTDMQEGHIKEFITKENKNFNYIKGLETFFNSDCDTNVSTSEFSVQGIGRATTITGEVDQQSYKVRIFIDNTCYIP
jgi:hypothetical protein